MQKSNYIYLGVAAGYMILAVIQFFTSGLLPMSVYVSIAWVSFEITLLELAKSLLQYIKSSSLASIVAVESDIQRCDKYIAAMSKFAELKDDFEEC